MPISHAKRTPSVLSPQPSQLRHQRQAAQTALPPSLDPLHPARDPSDTVGGNLPPQQTCRMRNVPRRRVQRPHGAHVQAVAVPGLGHGVVARVKVLAVFEMARKVLRLCWDAAVEAEKAEVFLGESRGINFGHA